MKNRNSTKTYHTHVGTGFVSTPNYKGLTNIHGITLIALVITIIILLILTGITINLTLGEHGIIKIAEKAGKNYVNAAGDEQKKLNDLLNEAEHIINGTGKEPELQPKVGDYVNYPVYYDNVSALNLSTNQRWTPADKYNGWRILSIDTTNQTVRLISAGVPISYRHRNDNITSVGNLTANFFTTAVNTAEYNFYGSGFKTAQNGTTITNINDVKTLFTNDYTQNYGSGETYIDNGNTYTYPQGNPKVQSMTKDDMDMLLGITTTNGTNLQNANDLLVLPTKGNSSESMLIWTVATNDDGTGMGIYGIANDYSVVSGASYCVLGVRPVVTLKTNVKFVKASNNINNTQTWNIEI